MTKSQNKHDIGNPYHDEEGKFTSPDGSAQSAPAEVSQTSSAQTESDLEGFVIKPFNPDSFDDFLSSFEPDKAEKAENLIKTSKSFFGVLNLRSVTSISLEDRKANLNNSINEYDPKQIANLSENEINALTIAEKATVAQMIVQQRLEKLDKEKADLEKQKEKELKDAIGIEANSLQKSEWTNLWVSIPSVKDFHTYYDKDDSGTSKIDRKREYFENAKKETAKWIAESKAIIDDPLSFEDDIESAKNVLSNLEDVIPNLDKKLAALDDFEQTGLKYLNLKEQLDLKYLPQFEQIESDYASAKKEQDILNSPDFAQFVVQAKDLISKYQDESAIYSQARKNNALWFKGHNVIEQAEKALFPQAGVHYSKMTQAEINRIKDYKNGSSKFNEPLRSLAYTGGKNFQGKTYSEAINEMTSAIDKCVWNDDIWVQRGQSANVNCFMINGIKKSIANMTEEERNSLIGTMYVDNGFFSAGAGKGTGFSSESLIINAYCPKGTKMVYAQYLPGYKTENEMILQRGYSYRITKIEKKGYQYYMDVEVILNSDQNKPVGQDLIDIGKKHYHGG